MRPQTVRSDAEHQADSSGERAFANPAPRRTIDRAGFDDSAVHW
jgi:hypothetical protein